MKKKASITLPVYNLDALPPALCKPGEEGSGKLVLEPALYGELFELTDSLIEIHWELEGCVGLSEMMRDTLAAGYSNAAAYADAMYGIASALRRVSDALRKRVDDFNNRMERGPASCTK